MKTLALLLLLPTIVFAQIHATASFDSITNNHSAFSGVVLVAEKGEPVYHKAFGYSDYTKQKPLQVTDVFEMASVSKQFTAMIIMMLQEKGELNYDDLIEKYLDIPYKGITIRHLLTHTSGLPDYQEIMDTHWDKSKVAGNPDILLYLNKYAPPKLFEPGTQYNYSNTGYVLLASIAEKASGKDFIKLSRKWIFKPLKMKSTNIRTPRQKAATKNFTVGHLWNVEDQSFKRADADPSSDYTIWLGNRKGPGRVSSTAEDLLKWDRTLKSERLVKQSTLNAAYQPVTLKNGEQSYYGFGWMIDADSKHGKAVRHTGDNPGYKTQIVSYLDAEKTIILLSNNAYPGLDQMINEFTSLIFNPAFSSK
jgi:CubicO group peptidase (beta-lactamase class C family)